MAKKIEIIGKSLIVTDTVTLVEEIDHSASDIYYDIKEFNDNSNIRFIVRTGGKAGEDQFTTPPEFDDIPLSNAVDVGDLSFTIGTWKTFARTKLDFSGGGGTFDNTTNESRLDALETLTIYNFVGAGEWDATTNTPDAVTTLVDDGDALRVSVAGTTTINGINEWAVGDIIYKVNGQIRKEDNTQIDTLLLPYDESKTYIVGEQVAVFNIPFVNKTAVTVAEVFDASKWTCLNRNLKSGIVSGGKAFNIAGTLFDFEKSEFFFVDNSDPTNFLVTPVTIGPLVGVTNILTSGTTQLLATVAGTIIQQDTISISDTLTNVNIGLIVNGGGAGIFFVDEPDTIYSTDQTFRAHMFSQGGQSLESVILSTGATGLTLNATAGLVESVGRGYVVDKDQADIGRLTLTNPVPSGDFFKSHTTNSGADFNFDNSNNLIDPNNYNPLGDTLQTVPAGKFQVQRAYVFGGSNDKIIYYGRTLYDTLEQALQSFESSDEFCEHPTSFPGAFAAHIIVQQGISDWSNADSFKFLTREGGVTQSWDRGIPSGGLGGLTTAQQQSSLAKESTGVISGGIVTAGTIPATQITQALGSHQVADHSTTPFTLKLIEHAAQTDIDLLTEAGADLTKALIYVFRLEDGTLNLVSTDTQSPTSQEFRDKVLHAVARTTFGLGTNVIRSISNRPLTLNAPLNQLQDGTIGTGFTTKEGNTILGNNPGIDFSINKLSGITKGLGVNVDASFDNPNTKSIAVINNAQYRYITALGEVTGTLLNDPDVAQLHDGTVFQSVGANQYSIKKLWFDPINNLFWLQYGTVSYSASDIDNGIHLQEESTEPPLLSQSAYVIARLVLRGNSTNFNSDARNSILQGDGVGGAGAGGGSGIIVIDNLTTPDPNSALSANMGNANLDQPVKTTSEVVHAKLNIDNLQLDGGLLSTTTGNLFLSAAAASNVIITGNTQISAPLAGTVGGFSAGNLRIKDPGTSSTSNAVITGHNSNLGDRQVWYIGNVSSSNENFGIINRRNGSIVIHPNNTLSATFEATGNFVLENLLQIKGLSTVGANEMVTVDSAGVIGKQTIPGDASTLMQISSLVYDDQGVAQDVLRVHGANLDTAVFSVDVGTLGTVVLSNGNKLATIDFTPDGGQTEVTLTATKGDEVLNAFTLLTILSGFEVTDATEDETGGVITVFGNGFTATTTVAVNEGVAGAVVFVDANEINFPYTRAAIPSDFVQITVTESAINIDVIAQLQAESSTTFRINEVIVSGSAPTFAVRVTGIGLGPGTTLGTVRRNDGAGPGTFGVPLPQVDGTLIEFLWTPAASQTFLEIFLDKGSLSELITFKVPLDVSAITPKTYDQVRIRCSRSSFNDDIIMTLIEVFNELDVDIVSGVTPIADPGSDTAIGSLPSAPNITDGSTTTQWTMNTATPFGQQVGFLLDLAQPEQLKRLEVNMFNADLRNFFDFEVWGRDSGTGLYTQLLHKSSLFNDSTSDALAVNNFDLRPREADEVFLPRVIMRSQKSVNNNTTSIMGSVWPLRPGCTYQSSASPEKGFADLKCHMNIPANFPGAAVVDRAWERIEYDGSGTNVDTGAHFLRHELGATETFNSVVYETLLKDIP